MQPDPEGDGEVSRLLGTAATPGAALLGGVALLLLWPLLRLGRALGRRWAPQPPAGPDA